MPHRSTVGLGVVDLDAPKRATIVLGAWPIIASLRATIHDEMPKFDLARLDKLPTYVRAMTFAHSIYSEPQRRTSYCRNSSSREFRSASSSSPRRPRSLIAGSSTGRSSAS
jgi:hypothetical protein